MEKFAACWLSLYICRKKPGSSTSGEIFISYLLYEEKPVWFTAWILKNAGPAGWKRAARIYVFVLHYDPAFTEEKALPGFLRETLSAYSAG